MRVITGKYRNKKIYTSLPRAKELDFKPTTSKTRQAVFNMLLNSPRVGIDVVGADVLDLCCGSGSFGIEALSRGAKHVTFIDIEEEHLKVARYNIESLNEASNCSFLRVSADRLPASSKKYNLIYIDPPYFSNLIIPTLNKLAEGKWLAKENMILIEAGDREKLELPEGFELLDHRKYGKTQLFFVKKG